MNNIDFRRHYILMIDTETANGLNDPLLYDLGCAVIDTHGNVYETASFVNKDIFKGCADLMQSAYYANKIPQYWEQIWAGERQMATLFQIRQAVWALMKKYRITDVCAHNARFDYRSTHVTLRYETSSKQRYFFPYGTHFMDTMKMAQSTICKQPTYVKWCKKNGYVCANGQVRKTAEILYRYISGEADFTEKHTGLEDVLIETQILAHCYRQHKKMNKYLW